MIKTRIHAIAGTIGFLTILAFWLSTVASETLGGPAVIASVKNAILWGMLVLIPCLMITGASGFALGKKRNDPRITAKKKRMPFIAANGIVILIPSAVFLADQAAAGTFGTAFYTVQAIELIAGAINLRLMGLNIRDGLALRHPLPKDEAVTE
jgi:hypothetical protein